MKAITVWQPWASLLATGAKHNETRSWRTNYRGEILIRAAKTDPLRGICMMPNEAWEQALIALDLPEEFNRFEKFPTGAIIGKANLVDCFQIDEAYRRKLMRENPAELAFGDYSIGRYAWVMAEPVLFDKPIPASGKQGLWNWEGELE